MHAANRDGARDTTNNPYRVQAPALISFSGGRTSGYMLRHVLDAHGGALPPGYEVTFFNTGRERPETLDFVRECGDRWGVEIVWLEYRNAHLPRRTGDVRVSDHCARVTYESASRDGEPFAALIASRNYLPNPVARYCTKELKLRLGRDWMLHRGHAAWRVVVGIRADEPTRLTATATVRGERVYPLADAGVTEADVMGWWAAQPFDLRIRQEEGNCDLCFLKARAKIGRLVTANPRLAGWWEGQERAMAARGGMARFREDRPSYAEYAELATTGGPLFAACAAAATNEDDIDDCNCTD